MITINCICCRKDKPFEDFSKKSSGKHGLNSKCKECCNEYQRIYRSKFPERRVEADRKYYSNNKKKTVNRVMNYRKTRSKVDPVYRLRKCLSVELRKTLTGNQVHRSKSRLFRIVGLLGEDLINYLWGTFEYRYGIPRAFISLEQVQIDHIIPTSKADTIEDLEKLNHYTNLQLLFKEDNVKKSDSLPINVQGGL